MEGHRRRTYERHPRTPPAHLERTRPKAQDDSLRNGNRKSARTSPRSMRSPALLTSAGAAPYSFDFSMRPATNRHHRHGRRTAVPHLASCPSGGAERYVKNVTSDNSALGVFCKFRWRSISHARAEQHEKSARLPTAYLNIFQSLIFARFEVNCQLDRVLVKVHSAKP